MAAKPHKGSCGPCSLCMKGSARYTHPDKMDQTVFQFISSLESEVDSAACICHACYKQAARNVGNHNYYPRWRQKTIAREHCGVDKCPQDVYRHTNITSPTQIETILKEKLSSFSVTDTVNTPLCQVHYNMVYSNLHAPMECDSCKVKPKKGEQHSRHCPAPDTVNSYITLISNEPSTLTDSSRICNSCYLFFHRTLNRIQHAKSLINELEPQEQPINVDTVLSTLSANIISIKSQQQRINKADFFELVLCYLAQYIATAMSSNEAMLLPDLCRKFQETLSSESSSFPHLSITTNEFPSTRWFICRLNHYFGDSIVFECRHRYIGTVVFHKNCDLLTALSTALGQQRSAERRAHCSLDVQINNVTSHFHGKLHEQAKRFTCEYKSPEKYTTMDFSALIQNTDQELLKFISQLTESKKKRKLFDSQEEQPISSKAIRHFYALCVLLFNTNSACCAPLHVLLTEAIICHGGNTELVKILNRVGAVACMDTCNRLTTQVVTQRLREGIKRAVICGVISFASIDNIDILQPWSVSVRSWHGTSVQIMQPFPQTGTLWEDELASILTSTSSDLAHLNLSDSPIPVQRLKRRRRTLTEQPSPHTTMISPTNIPIPDVDGISYDFNERSPSISDFHLTEAETGAFKKLHEEIFLAMLLKYFNSGLEHTLNLPALPSLVHCLKKQAFEAECSNVAYVDILSEKSDSKATLLKVIGNLHKIFIKELNQKWVIVVGDAKIFVLLQELRIEYGENLRWLLPLPGDWHILFNFQKVLVKPYADAGIMSLAKVCGYGAETLKSLRNANKFRRTHLFFLQCFEAFYEFFLGMFFARDSIPPIEKERLKLVVHDLLHEFEEVNDVGSLEAFRANASLVIADKLPQSYDKFTAFMKNGSIQQDTMKFWHRFLFEDCFPYIALFTAIRYRNWNLRTGSLKQLAAIYRAFDRPTYQELIPRHLFDLAKLPESILSKLNDGGFAMRLSNTDWRGVALDECHEMNINKDAKLAVIRPSPEKMQFLSSSLPFWAKVINNMKEQLFPERQKHKTAQCYTATTRDKAVQANVRKMVAALQSHAQFFDPEENKGLWNFLDMVQATPDQAHDLLNFRAIGQEAFDNLVKCRMLKIASTSAPVRKKRLQTFTTTPTHKKRIKQVEKERKITQRLLKRQLAWMAENNCVPPTDMFASASSLPKALVDKNGLPYKSTKSSTTKYLMKRYKDSPIISSHLPWFPTSVILEGMFMIQSAPLPTNENMKEYANMLFIRYVKFHYTSNAIDVHVIFDNPGGLPESPKEIEQGRRDAATLTEQHQCLATIASSTAVPKNWRLFLGCRTCKAKLTSYLAEEFLQVAPGYMINSDQEFFSNQKGRVYSVNQHNELLQRPSYFTNMDEADMRIWLHCMHGSGQRVLIFSPDTDVYHIGLVVAQHIPHKSIVIQLSKSLVDSASFLDLNALLQALQGDPDLCNLPPPLRPQALQSLYVCTGCDYISFFAGIGKCTFLSTFFQYASFIASGSDPPGSIGQISLNHSDLSLYSFMRLVGCAYFRSHTSAFEHTSPVSLYHSLSSTTLFDTHKQWLALIRKAVWLRADKESQNVPTAEALRLHWYRCLWVLGIWHSATENEFELPPLTEYGWQRSGSKLEVIWDTPENIKQAHQQVEFILHGCKCKTGCSTRRCKCKKGGRACGPGCQCLHCMNSASRLPSADILSADVELEVEEEEVQSSTFNDDSTDTSSDELSDHDDLEGDVAVTMQDIFGDSDSEDEEQ